MGTCHVPKLAVDLASLQELFEEARRLTDHGEFVVIGSLSILGVVRDAVPESMLVSIDVDCYTRADPGRVYELAAKLGEASDFRTTHGD